MPTGPATASAPHLVGGPLAWEPLPEPARRRRWWLWAVPLLLVAGLLAGATFVPLPYYAISPGSARQVADLIEVPDDQRHPAKGEVLLTTVSLGDVNAWEALAGWLDPDTDVVPEEDILGSVPRDRLRQINLQLMGDSKQVAVVVALRRLGYDVAEHGTGALVVAVGEGTPAAGKLQAGDAIVAVDGTPTTRAADVVAAIRTRAPGDTVRLELDGGSGTRRSVEIGLAKHPQEAHGFLGVSLSTREQRFDLPFPVDIESGRIGGPSAGLAFTLGVLDALRPGELTGGRKVAVTGTIELDGTVGDVGGVAQKTAAVKDAGADVFLVPAGEFEEARKRAGDELEVVSVKTLEDALAALARLGGDVAALGPAPGVRG